MLLVQSIILILIQTFQLMTYCHTVTGKCCFSCTFPNMSPPRDTHQVEESSSYPKMIKCSAYSGFSGIILIFLVASSPRSHSLFLHHISTISLAQTWSLSPPISKVGMFFQYSTKQKNTKAVIQPHIHIATRQVGHWWAVKSTLVSIFPALGLHS